jgi:hypothetical protein
MDNESKSPEQTRAENRSELPTDEEIDEALDRLIAKQGTSSPNQDLDAVLEPDDDSE